jgi:adenylate cyclase
VEQVRRKLAAILAADVVGYSRLMERDEEGTLAYVKNLGSAVIRPTVEAHGGRLVKTTGDGFLVEFASPVEAVRAAMAIQTSIASERPGDAPDGLLRIGINLGDVIADGDDVYGDGVNVAARLEALAGPGGICISRSVRDQIRDRLPVHLSDQGEIKVKNLTRPVRVFAIQLDMGEDSDLAVHSASTGRGAATTSERSTSPAPRLSIAVLPFAIRPHDPEYEYFADGITEDLIADLSRLPGSFVIARSTAFAYRGRHVDAKQVARELGVRYIVEGSVRRVGEQIRLSVQLVDGELGTPIWADRLDTDRAVLGEAQDVITASLARALDVQLFENVRQRLEREGEPHPDARDLVMRGWAWFYRSPSADTMQSAIRDFEAALSLEPASIDAKVGLATAAIMNVAEGWAGDAEREKERAGQLLTNALQGDPNRSAAHFAMGCLRRLQGRLNESRFSLQRAVNLNPSDARALRQLATTHIFLGEPSSAIPLVERALRLSPRDTDMASYYWALGLSHLLLGNAAAAADLLTQARSENPRAYYIHLCLAGAHGLSGEIHEARAAIEQSLALGPGIDSIARWQEYAIWDLSPGFLSLAEPSLYAGLRKAGFPDESRPKG